MLGVKAADHELFPVDALEMRGQQFRRRAGITDRRRWERCPVFADERDAEPWKISVFQVAGLAGFHLDPPFGK